jgi:hypothetical protein
VEDEDMAGLGPALLGEELAEILLDAHRIGFPSPAEAASQSLDVGIDDHSGDREDIAKNNIGGLASDPREGDQIFHPARHFAAVVSNQSLGTADDVFRLVAEEAGGADEIFQFGGISCRQGLGIGVAGKEGGGDLVDPDIGTLRR